jgi:fructose-specific phosphotransferase system IIA component
LAKILGELFRRWKQPTLTAEILVGVILGPTILGRFLPQVYQFVFPQDPIQENMLQTVAWLGLLFFLLETGLKMDFSSAWRHRGKALTIAFTDIAVPLTLSFIACLFLPSRYLVDPSQRLVFSLFMATAMTISAMPTAVRALHDLDLSKTDLGFLIMSALSVNEIIGWVLFAFILHMITPVTLQIERMFAVFSAIVFFIIFCLSVGRKFVNTVISKIREYDLPEPGSSLTFISLLGMLCGAVFQKIGVHALMGFFVAGVMAGEARALPERTRQVISQMVYAIFIPLFFAGIGLKVDFLARFDLFLVLFVTGIGIFVKLLGAWLGSIFSGLAKANRMPLAIAHTPGGSMEIVIGILALQYGLISESVFVAIVCGGVISSVILGPWLKFVINRRKEISILEFFSRSTIIAQIKATERNAVIHELCNIIAEQGHTPHTETLYSAVIRRENTMGTAIEEGIALPHARLASLMRPVIAFGRSQAGIDWNSPDGKPTHLVFLILTSKENDWQQVQILRLIAKTVANEKIRDALLQAGDAHEIWNILEQQCTSHCLLKKT